MKRYPTFLFLLLALSSFSTKASEQDSLKTQAKNVIYGSAGTLGLVGNMASVNYERLVFTIDKGVYVNYYMRGSYGGFASWFYSGPAGSLSLQGVFGAKKSHFELGLGVGGIFDKNSYESGVISAKKSPEYFSKPIKSDFSHIFPAATIGYRYQKPTGGFVFRTGIGYPDSIYLSLGLAF